MNLPMTMTMTMTMTSSRSLPPRACLTLALAAGAACQPPQPENTDTSATAGDSDDLPEDWLDGHPELSAPCALGTDSPRRLVITTTDFTTGAVSIVDTASRTITADVTLGSSDALPFHSPHEAAAGHVYLLHRFMIDALDVLDVPGGTWATISQQAITTEAAASANAHSIAFADDGLAYVTLFGAPEVQVFSLADPQRPARIPDDDGERVATIDLAPVADADGNPEASLSLVCGDTLFVSIGLLDENKLYTPTADHDVIVAIDRETGLLHDLDDAPGIQGLPTLGEWARQWRLDPRDPDGHTVLVLTTGLERLDLSDGTISWAVDAETFAAAGISGRLQPQSFAVSPDGSEVHIAGYTGDFSSVTIFRADLDAGGSLQPVVTGISSGERALERVGDELWYGDTTPGEAGVQALDLGVDPPAPIFPAPQGLGLAPYSMIAIP